jgi:hypothetical protein
VIRLIKIVTSCGVCTKAELNTEGTKIVGTLDLSKAQMQYNKGTTPITKNVTVFLNDGRRRFIGKEGTKVSIVNPDKEFERLNIACVVEKK